MINAKKFGSIIFAILLIGVALVILLVPNIGYKIAGGVLGAGIVLLGVKKIIYYITMAKNMIGGKRILFNGIILFDFGLLALLLIGESQGLMMIYFIVLYLLYGLIDILRFIEIRKQKSFGWQTKLIKGIFCISVAVVCLIFNSSADLVVLLFAIGLIGIAIEKIINAFTKSQIIFIK